MADETKTATPKETPKAAAAYAAYAAMGPSRSLRKLADELKQKGDKKTTLRHLADWSSAYRWQERVKGYDQERAAAHEQRRERADRRRAANAAGRRWLAQAGRVLPQASAA